MTAEEKLLDEYWYSTKDPVGEEGRGVKINTGKAGISLIIGSMIEMGVPDEIIQKEITIFLEGQWIPLEAVHHTYKKVKDV